MDFLNFVVKREHDSIIIEWVWQYGSENVVIVNYKEINGTSFLSLIEYNRGKVKSADPVDRVKYMLAVTATISDGMNLRSYTKKALKLRIVYRVTFFGLPSLFW